MERCATWVSRQSAHRAKALQQNDGSDYLIVTHAFHPLAGQQLEVLFERRLPTGLAYSCDGGALGRMMMPATWTDRDAPERPTRLSYEVLVELGVLITAIKRSITRA